MLRRVENPNGGAEAPLAGACEGRGNGQPHAGLEWAAAMRREVRCNAPEVRRCSSSQRRMPSNLAELCSSQFRGSTSVPAIVAAAAAFSSLETGCAFAGVCTSNSAVVPSAVHTVLTLQSLPDDDEHVRSSSGYCSFLKWCLFCRQGARSNAMPMESFITNQYTTFLITTRGSSNRVSLIFWFIYSP
ncbi:hypothetical protein SETIT_2G281000v2 [Setaria italica]|uniref:Uncharacterized protein n=1 Tax=Setaria italica TaxID=4555 RepID=A0A368Q3H8_SETIT|nr:uncharacterized protein LOC111256330 [Setaria italica]RCV12586.1 hypothetical protein SETIT_2G281000v2 [Setaria italica]RCV12587.1 hypothetical protein SETIT_2G281000v2 [Setaria italica]